MNCLLRANIKFHLSFCVIFEIDAGTLIFAQH